MQLISSRFSSRLAVSAKRFLQHRCTLAVKFDTGDIDDDENPIFDYTDSTGIPCLFLWQDRNITDDRGIVTEKVPVLYLLGDQQITEADLVKNVRNRINTITLLTSAKINTIDTTAEGGNAILKVCELEGAVL